MSNFFEQFSQVTGKDLPVPEGLTTEQKAALVFQLHMAGESMLAITNYLGITRGYGYTLKKMYESELKGELECRTFLDNSVSALSELRATREFHRKRVSHLQNLIVNGRKNTSGNKLREKTSLNRDLSEAARIVLAYDKLIIDYEIKFGILPNTETNPYGSLKDKDKTADAQGAQELTAKNPEELIAILISRLTNKGPSIMGKGLKEIQHDSIL